ncbi:MAG: hypothetical protein JNM72_22430 [Deltaproteobacteria bacterium]|nr:hypothetical protein [Deltaproteobacteria bacterium]
MEERRSGGSGARRARRRPAGAARALGLGLGLLCAHPVPAAEPAAAPPITGPDQTPPATPPGFSLRPAGPGRWTARHADGVTLEWSRLPLRRRWTDPDPAAAVEAARLLAELGPDAQVDVLDAVIDDGVLQLRLRPRLGGAAGVAALRAWSTPSGALRLRLVGPASRSAALDAHLEAAMAALAPADLPAGALPLPADLVHGGCQAPAGLEPLLPEEEETAAALLGPPIGLDCAVAVERSGGRPTLLRWCTLAVKLPDLGAAGGVQAAEAALGLGPLVVEDGALRANGALILPVGAGAVRVEALAFPDDAPPVAAPLRPACAPPAPTFAADLRRAWGLRPRGALIAAGLALMLAALAWGRMRRPTS